MKKLSVLILIAALCLVGWALPAGAEKIRLTDAELDAITAGTAAVGLTIPPPTSVGCCVNLSLNALGSLGGLDPSGSLFLDLLTKGPVQLYMFNASGDVSMGHGRLGVGGTIMGPKGITVPLSFNLGF